MVLLHKNSSNSAKIKEETPSDSRCGSVETCRNASAVLPGRSRGHTLRIQYVRSQKTMASVTLKNIKKVYPFNGDDAKKKKKKKPSAAQPPRQGDATRRPHPQGKPRGERPSREGGQRGEGRQRPMERSSQQPRRSHEKAAETGETQQQRPPMPPHHGEVKENAGGNESK